MDTTAEPMAVAPPTFQLAEPTEATSSVTKTLMARSRVGSGHIHTTLQNTMDVLAL
jgi:hypothetical protein